MRKLTSILLAVMLVVSMCAVGIVGASAEGEDAAIYTVTGTENLFGSTATGGTAWTPAPVESNTMKFDQYAGVYYINITTINNDGVTPILAAAAGEMSYKVTDGTWANAWGEGNAPGGPDKNINFGDIVEGTPVDVISITFDPQAQVTEYKVNETYVVNPNATTVATTTNNDPTEAPTEPTTYPLSESDQPYATGDATFFGANAWGEAWADGKTDLKMIYDANARLWYINITTIGNIGEEPLVNSADEAKYKVALNGSWDVAYNEGGEAHGYDTDAIINVAASGVGEDEVIPCLSITLSLDTGKTSHSFEPYVPAEAKTTLAEEQTTPAEEQTTPAEEQTTPAEVPTTPELDYAIVNIYDTEDTDTPTLRGKYEIGDTFDYTVNLRAKVPGVVAFNLHTWFNQEGKTKVNDVDTAVVEFVEEDFNPYFSSTVLNNDKPNQLLYNYGSAAPNKKLDFTVEEGVEIVTLTFKVVAPGEISIWTDIVQLLENDPEDPTATVDAIDGSVIISKTNPEPGPIPEITTPAEVPTPDPSKDTLTAVGDKALFGEPGWVVDDSNFHLTYNEETGLWSIDITTVGNDGVTPITVTGDAIPYKIALNDSWDISYNHEGPALGDAGNANINLSEYETGAVIERITIFFNPETLSTSYELVMAEEPITTAPAPVEDPTTVPVEDPTTVPVEDPTTAPGEDTTTTTSGGKVVENPTTTKSSGNGGGNGGSNNTSAGKGVATGDSTSIAMLLGVLMLAAGAVVVTRKKISQ